MPTSAPNRGKDLPGMEHQVAETRTGMPPSAHSLQDGEASESATSVQTAKMTASAVDPASTAAAACKQGLLTDVPDGWLHLFIRTLPHETRAALLACSWQLARHVLGAPASVTLCLQSCKPQDPDPLDCQTQQRRSIITHLLQVRQQFAVKLCPGSWQPFPIDLAARVTYLTIDVHGFTFEHWHAMTGLRTVCLSSCFPTSVVTSNKLLSFHTIFTHCASICAAVAAGQLQQLRNVEIMVTGVLANLDSLVCALGPQLEELTTCDMRMFRVVHHLTRLTHLTLGSMTCRVLLTGGVMQQLCKHPTLRHTVLRNCQLEGDCSGLSCEWESLTVWNARVDELLWLPLAGVCRVQLVRRVYGPVKDVQAVGEMLTQSAHKLVCQPDPSHSSDGFCFHIGCAAMVPIVRCMHVTKLVLRGNVLALPGKDTSTPFNLLWPALPTCIESIAFEGYALSELSALWQGLPQHVHEVSLALWGDDFFGVRSLVGSTPPHVHRVVLHCEFSHATACESVCLRSTAHPHVKVKVAWH